jgi:hypothetical protein
MVNVPINKKQGHPLLKKCPLLINKFVSCLIQSVYSYLILNLQGGVHSGY